MSKKYDFKYTVIGSGPAGTAAALTLAKAKKRVAIIESRFLGGSNLNTLDIPYAVALDFAHSYSKVRSFPELKNQNLTFNYPSIAARELKAIIETGGNNKEAYEKAGIICLNGRANLLDPHTVAINDKKITSEYFILATGAHLKTIGISGTDQVSYCTPETAIKLRRLPKVIAVVGAGSTGCEIAEYYAELGAKVILFETETSILPREDKEVSDTIASYFTKKLGISILGSCKVTAIQEDNFSKCVIFQCGGSEKMVRVETIVLATGSEPTLDYGLENAKVKFQNSGILVNKFFETSTKNIYAIGDALGRESSTDRAYQEGLTLAHNLINRSKNIQNYVGFIRTTNTMPEIATVGFNEFDLIKRDRKYKKAIVNLSEVSASKIYNFEYGFIKLIADKNGHLVGACVVAPSATLIAGELSLAIRHNLTAIELASTPHNINSYNYLIKLAAKKLVQKKR